VTQPRPFHEFAVGQSATLRRVVRAEDVDRFAELTGDDNPLHMDPAYGEALGVGGRVAHGMLTAGYVSTAIGTMLPGPGALWLSEAFQFRAPVRIDDEIDVTVVVRHASPSTRVLVLDVTVTNHRGTTVLEGEASVHVLDRLAGVSDTRATAGPVIVTGSARGIGAAIATRLAADGLPVVVNYRSDAAAAERTAASIRDAGGTASVCQADVTVPDDVRALVDHATNEFGPVEAIINNAGTPTNPRPLGATSWDDMTSHLDAHLRASFLCVEAVLPGMLERGFGRIVNITSQSAYGTPPEQMTGYVVAKAALAAFTRCVALETAPHGVTANAVAPGMVDTELVAEIPQRTKLTLAAQTPLRRLAVPDDVANAVSFLLGAGGGYVTGQTIHLSGGQVMS